MITTLTADAVSVVCKDLNSSVDCTSGYDYI